MNLIKDALLDNIEHVCLFSWPNLVVNGCFLISKPHKYHLWFRRLCSLSAKDNQHFYVMLKIRVMVIQNVNVFTIVFQTMVFTIALQTFYLPFQGVKKWNVGINQDQKRLKAVIRKCYIKKVFLKILQNWQENTCARVSFLINLQASACNFIKKETLAQVSSCKFWEIFYRTSLVAASENYKSNYKKCNCLDK